MNENKKLQGLLVIKSILINKYVYLGLKYSLYYHQMNRLEKLEYFYYNNGVIK
ncbi:hypothetical protein M947_06465 [Sulfurimonas hongkongensis]|uniref:Uncharacterized protein n=1 Tax=Sulfurimonas hongkongensis TaxID=1172190 RepID=T0L1K5_9BACT|nr:hypothetical protein M947_06465 [Sulfurimonas hongkongensis]